ncbi:hypothetical protein [Hoeflea olei]|nr:hypothetical protein [Hoeflea olei]
MNSITLCRKRLPAMAAQVTRDAAGALAPVHRSPVGGRVAVGSAMHRKPGFPTAVPGLPKPDRVPDFKADIREDGE